MPEVAIASAERTEGGIKVLLSENTDPAASSAREDLDMVHPDTRIAEEVLDVPPSGAFGRLQNRFHVSEAAWGDTTVLPQKATTTYIAKLDVITSSGLTRGNRGPRARLRLRLGHGVHRTDATAGTQQDASIRGSGRVGNQ